MGEEKWISFGVLKFSHLFSRFLSEFETPFHRIEIPKRLMTIRNNPTLANKWRIIFIRNTPMILDSLVWNFDRWYRVKFCLPGDRVLYNVIDNIIDNRDDCERDDLERKRKENVNGVFASVFQVRGRNKIVSDRCKTVLAHSSYLRDWHEKII